MLGKPGEPWAAAVIFSLKNQSISSQMYVHLKFIHPPTPLDSFVCTGRNLMSVAMGTAAVRCPFWEKGTVAVELYIMSGHPCFCRCINWSLRRGNMWKSYI